MYAQELPAKASYKPIDCDISDVNGNVYCLGEQQIPGDLGHR